MRASVIVAAYNEGPLLLRTVQAVVETAGTLEYELVVADDASTDGSVAAVREAYPQVRVVPHLRRQGTSATKALGGLHATGDVLVFLDGHTNPEAGALERLVQDVEELDGRFIVTPRVPALNPETWTNSCCQSGHGYGTSLETFETWWVPLHQMKTVTEGGRTYHESPALIGCALAVSRELYMRVHGFDPRMRTWGVEDLDFGLRAWMLGSGILHDPEVRIGHRFRKGFDTFAVPQADVLANKIRTARKVLGPTTWAAWVKQAKRRYGGGSATAPAELWTEAWALYKLDQKSANAERAYVLGHRSRDEFGYAARVGRPWPALAGSEKPAKKRKKQERAARKASLQALDDPSPFPPPACTITSSTFYSSTDPNSRRTVAFREQVTLTWSGTSATWTSSDGSLIGPNPAKSIEFDAPAFATGSVTVTATDTSNPDCTDTATFNVIQPTGIVFVFNTAAYHTVNAKNVGMCLKVYFSPSRVNFYQLSWSEADSNWSGTGYWSCITGTHCGGPCPLIACTTTVTSTGTYVGVDNCWVGTCSSADNTSSISVSIIEDWQVNGGGASGSFESVTESGTMTTSGGTTTMTMSKSTATAPPITTSTGTNASSC